jgi:hypothetical protein
LFFTKTESTFRQECTVCLFLKRQRNNDETINTSDWIHLTVHQDYVGIKTPPWSKESLVEMAFKILEFFGVTQHTFEDYYKEEIEVNKKCK